MDEYDFRNFMVELARNTTCYPYFTQTENRSEERRVGKEC